MNLVAFTGAVVFGLLLAEWRLSRMNERGLRQRGAYAPQGDVYRLMAVVYPVAFAAMTAEGLWRASYEAAEPGGPNWWVSGALLFSASKGLKYWAIRALGPRWSFRVYVVPGLPLVRHGPYRFVAHPNYVAIVGELVGTAMMCGAPTTGIAGLAVFGFLLWRRIRFESGILGRLKESE